MKAAAVLGITGGIFGLMGGLFAVMFGSAFDSQSSIATQGWVAIVASIVAIFASTRAKENPKSSGWLLITSGVVGLIAISLFYILPAVLLIIGGISALRKASKKKSGRNNSVN